mmetsp:Transcript_29763/g.83874  ORF Transcript_29763/g.83874 Transcript_29763/m.83874 type:complete len:116 (-) Transcript_29763:1865-2212(-)
MASVTATVQGLGMVPRAEAPLREALACDICGGLLKEATTAVKCCHTFCRECIDGEIEEGGKRNYCPVCGEANILGPYPYGMCLAATHGVRPAVPSVSIGGCMRRFCLLRLHRGYR